MNEFLVQLIVVAVLANVVLLLAALIIPRLRRPPRPLAAAAPGPAIDAMSVSPIAISAMPSRPDAPSPTSPEPEPAVEGGPDTDMREDSDDTQRQRRFVLPRDDEYPTPESVEAFLTAGQRRGQEPESMIDEQTGLETGFAWEMVVDREEKRVARYGKSVTVVIAELDRLEALSTRLGAENADRLVTPVATTLRRLARAADLVARTGHSRFQVLMPETDEVQAINYVERVRDACDMWLEASAVSVRLVAGWASAGAGVTIRDAARLAEQRMHADRARTGYGRGRPAVAAVGPARSAHTAPGDRPEAPSQPAPSQPAPIPAAAPPPVAPATPSAAVPADGAPIHGGSAYAFGQPGQGSGVVPPTGQPPQPNDPYRSSPGTGPTV
ncbi:MAG TPA: diguanylate cyclase [Candidatus Dormibacteraeota bacterium]|nr:diguanylate cyclase [Candidatus Dormibacteraeota bacterium]